MIFIKLKGGFKIANWMIVTQKELVTGKKETVSLMSEINAYNIHKIRDNTKP